MLTGGDLMKSLISRTLVKQESIAEEHENVNVLLILQVCEVA